MATGSTCRPTLIWRWPKIRSASRQPKSTLILMVRTARCGPCENPVVWTKLRAESVRTVEADNQGFRDGRGTTHLNGRTARRHGDVTRPFRPRNERKSTQPLLSAAYSLTPANA